MPLIWHGISASLARAVLLPVFVISASDTHYCSDQACVYSDNIQMFAFFGKRQGIWGQSWLYSQPHCLVHCCQPVWHAKNGMVAVNGSDTGWTV